MSLYDRLYNKDQNLNKLQALASALQSQKSGDVTVNPYKPVEVIKKADEPSALGGAGSLLSGAGKLYGGLRDSGLLDKSADNIDYSSFAPKLTGNALSDAVTNNVYDLGIKDNALTNAIDSSVGASAGGFNGMPLIGNALGGVKGLAKSGSWQGGLQGVFGVNEDDSDVMQGINGTLNGGLTGFTVGGPIGAAIGAALGLGSSFIDDI